MSKDAIKKFLQDTQNYPDTTMVKIGDQEVPLSSLRALNSEERQQLDAAMKSATERQAELDNQRKSVLDLSTKAQQTYEQAQELLKKAAPQPNPGNDPWQDPWLSPVKAALETRDKQLEELKTHLRTLLTAFTNSVNIYTADRYEREYQGLNFGKREKKPTQEEILKFATENKIVDRHGIPSIRAAWDKMSEADRLEEIRQEALEKGREEGRQQAIASRIPPPNVPGPGINPPPNRTPGDGTLGDLWAEANKDPELRAMIEQLPPGLIQ
jgi:hypothetical protein